MAKALRAYLKQKQADFEERGTSYMVPVIQEILDKGINNVDGLKQKLLELSQQKEESVKYSAEFQYLWGVCTYLQDLITHAPIQDQEEKK